LVVPGVVECLQGDILTFEPPSEPCDIIIHGATNASAQLNRDKPLLMLDTIVSGTRRVLDYARTCGTKRVLNMSSGGIYGRFPPQVSHVAETDCIAPDPTNPYYTYSESKRMGELLCALYRAQHGVDAVSARIFALVGPHLPLDIHFALGNFIGDVLAGRDIRIQGDGTAVRSYLYAADLAVWLFALLARGASGEAYNVGSDRAVSIYELAQLVRKTASVSTDIIVEGRAEASNPVSYYVPDITKARSTLGLGAEIDLEAGIRRTIQWHQERLSHGQD